jgi:CBS domain containing-hemolysin-like protein
MGTTEPTYSPQPLPNTRPRSRNGLGVAALVIGVASLVAAVSFVLFPLGLLAGLVGLIIAITLSVRVGTWAARNTDVFARFDKCVAQASNRAAVSVCISNFADEVRR